MNNNLYFFFNDPATTEIYTLSLHDALPISPEGSTPGTVPTVLTRPCGVTRSSRALSRSVTSASPPGRKAIAHGTARFRASTAGSPMCAVGCTAPRGAGALRPGGEPALPAQAPHTRPAHAAIAAITRERMNSPRTAGQALSWPYHHHPAPRRGPARARRGPDPR